MGGLIYLVFFAIISIILLILDQYVKSIDRTFSKFRNFDIEISDKTANILAIIFTIIGLYPIICFLNIFKSFKFEAYLFLIY